MHGRAPWPPSAVAVGGPPGYPQQGPSWSDKAPWPPSAVAVGDPPSYPQQGPSWSDRRAATEAPLLSQMTPLSRQPSASPYQPSQAYGTLVPSPVCVCGRLFTDDSPFCCYCGAKRFVGSPLPMSPVPTQPDAAEPEFSASAVLVARPTGVPEVLFAGRKATDREREKALDVEEARLERQLELEAGMQGVEHPYAAKVVQPQVDNQHPSKMPGWSRREWVDDPFYGWRTQAESKVPKVPALTRAQEAAKRAAVERRLAEIHGEMPAPAAQEPAGAGPAGPEMLLRGPPGASGLRPLPPSAALVSQDHQPPQPSWHDAVIKERIVAASHTVGSLALQDEALKQAAVTDFRLPVNAAVNGYLEPDANPARLVDVPDNTSWSERAPKAADKNPATGKPPSMLWFLGL